VKEGAEKKRDRDCVVTHVDDRYERPPRPKHQHRWVFVETDAEGCKLWRCAGYPQCLEKVWLLTGPVFDRMAAPRPQWPPPKGWLKQWKKANGIIDYKRGGR
jgi:hypothetical protein